VRRAAQENLIRVPAEQGREWKKLASSFWQKKKNFVLTTEKRTVRASPLRLKILGSSFRGRNFLGEPRVLFLVRKRRTTNRRGGGDKGGGGRSPYKAGQTARALGCSREERRHRKRETRQKERNLSPQNNSPKGGRRSEPLGERDSKERKKEEGKEKGSSVPAREKNRLLRRAVLFPREATPSTPTRKGGTVPMGGAS